MSVENQPEALRLADFLTDMDDYILDQSAAELRRLHALIAELVRSLGRIEARCPIDHVAYRVASIGDIARAALAKAKAQP